MLQEFDVNRAWNGAAILSGRGSIEIGSTGLPAWHHEVFEEFGFIPRLERILLKSNILVAGGCWSQNAIATSIHHLLLYHPVHSYILCCIFRKVLYNRAAPVDRPRPCQVRSSPGIDYHLRNHSKVPRCTRLLTLQHSAMIPSRGIHALRATVPRHSLLQQCRHVIHPFPSIFLQCDS